MEVILCHQMHGGETAVCGSVLDELVGFLRDATKAIPEHLMSDGVLELRTRSNVRHNEPADTQLILEIIPEREPAGHDQADVQEMIRRADVALDAAVDAECSLFEPCGSTEGFGYCLPTGLYRYEVNNYSGALVMALNTEYGQFYASFAHNIHSYDSAQNSLTAAGFLFYTLARGLVALNPEGTGTMLDYGVASLFTRYPAELHTYYGDPALTPFTADSPGFDQCEHAVVYWVNMGLGEKLRQRCLALPEYWMDLQPYFYVEVPEEDAEA